MNWKIISKVGNLSVSYHLLRFLHELGTMHFIWIILFNPQNNFMILAIK